MVIPLALQERFLPAARLEAAEGRFLSLFSRVVARIPEGTDPVASVEMVRLEDSGELEGLVGLTRWSAPSRQSVTFYSSLFDELSDAAAVAVIAHELAHAWLNEHVGPEESPRRERDADELARAWGFSADLEALGMEAENVGGSTY